MAIKSGQPIPEASLSGTQAITNSSASETKEVYLLSAYNSTGVNIQATAYLSSDATIASGEPISTLQIPAGETVDLPKAVVGKTKYYLVDVDNPGLVIHGAYILRNGGDA